MLACHGATPCPWSHESLRAFVHSHRADMQAIFRRQHAAQQHRLRRFGFNDSGALFVQLRNEGLRYNALGLDFTWLQRALAKNFINASCPMIGAIAVYCTPPTRSWGTSQI